MMIAYTQEELDAMNDVQLRFVLNTLENEMDTVKKLRKEDGLAMTFSFLSLSEGIATVKRELHYRELTAM